MSFDSVVKLAEKIVDKTEHFQNNNTSPQRNSNSSGLVFIYLIAVLLYFIGLLIAALIVKLSYNYVMPKLVMSFRGSDKVKMFQPLEYISAIALLILTKSLF